MNSSNDDTRPDAIANRSPKLLRPLNGWVLEGAMMLDEEAPGFLRHGMSSRVGWRQAFAAALAGGLVLNDPAKLLERALGDLVDVERPWANLLGEVGQLLPAMRPVEIIEAGLERCPDGFRGALEKLGVETMRTPMAYMRLFDIFASSDPAMAPRRRVIEQLGALDEERLEIIEKLDPIFLTPSVVAKVRTPEHADFSNSTLASIRTLCSTATDDAIADSLGSGPRVTLAEWARNWFRRADRAVAVNVPWAGEPDFEPVSLANVRRVAQDFRNCLAERKIGALVSGTWSAAIVAVGDQKALATLSLLNSGHWLLTGIHGHANLPVREEIRVAVRARIEGIKGCAIPQQPARELLPATKAFHHFADLAFEGLEDD